MGKPTIVAWLFALLLMLSSGGSESAVSSWLTATAFATAILLSILFLFKNPGVVLVSLAALGLGSCGQGREPTAPLILCESTLDAAHHVAERE